MGELLPDYGNIALSRSETLAYAEHLMAAAARPATGSASGYIGYIPEKCGNIKGAAESQSHEATSCASDDEAEAKCAAHEPPRAPEAEEIVVPASQSEDEDSDRGHGRWPALRRRWPALWRGDDMQECSTRVPLDESSDEEVYRADRCGFRPVSSPRPMETVSSPRPMETVSSPRPEETVSSPRPEETVSSPRPEETVSSPRPEETVSSPRPVKPRFTLQKCIGISPLAFINTARSPEAPQFSLSQASSRNSQQSSRRSPRYDTKSTPRSSQGSRRSGRRSSQNSHNSSQRSRASHFRRRSPLRSPPLLPRSPTISFGSLPSSLTSFDTEEFSTSTSISNSPRSPRDEDPRNPAEGAAGLNFEQIAQETNQDHQYSWMCAGDMIEIEVVSSQAASDDLAMTPDSLDRESEVPSQAGVLVDNKEGGKRGLSCAPAGFGTEDMLECAAGGPIAMTVERPDANAVGQECPIGSTYFDQDGVVDVERPVANSVAHDQSGPVKVGHPVESTFAHDQDGVMEVKRSVAQITAHDQDSVVDLEHPDASTVDHDKNGAGDVDRPAGSILARDQDGVVEVERPAGSISVRDQDGVVEVEHLVESTFAHDQDGVVEVKRPVDRITAHDQDGVVEVERSAGSISARDRDGVVEVERHVESTSARDQDGGVEAHDQGHVVVGEKRVKGSRTPVDHVVELKSPTKGIGTKAKYGVLEVDYSFGINRLDVDHVVDTDVFSVGTCSLEKGLYEMNDQADNASNAPVVPNVSTNTEQIIREGSTPISEKILRDNCFGGPNLFGPLEPEEIDDLVPEYFSAYAHNESTDLFEDGLEDLALQSPVLVAQHSNGSDDDLIHTRIPRKDISFCDTVNVHQSSVPAKIEEDSSNLDVFSEIQKCSSDLSSSDEDIICSQKHFGVKEDVKFVVDVEAETLGRFTYYNRVQTSQEKGPSDLWQDVSESSPSNSKPVEDDLEESIGSSSSPNRDIDALYLTQCAPLKRKALFKGENHTATKRTRKSWEQWYQQFKTIVATGREKLRAQNNQTTSGKTGNRTPPFSETHSSDTVNAADCFEGQNQSINSFTGQSCKKSLEQTNYVCQEDEYDSETESSCVQDMDQLVPAHENLDNLHDGCNPNTSLFKWSSVEPAREQLHGNENLSRTSSVTPRPVRVGLSKRAHPKPLHVRRPWWVFGVLKDFCSLQ